MIITHQLEIRINANIENSSIKEVHKKLLTLENLDIIEQAWIETMLEKQYDNIIFPYGNNWFKNTKQIIDFLETYPTYLKHMNPRLPWYNNIKNPFYLTGQIDESK